MLIRQMTSIQIRVTAVARNADVASWKSLVVFGTSSLTVNCFCSALHVYFLGSDIAGSNIPPEEASTSGKHFLPVL